MSDGSDALQVTIDDGVALLHLDDGKANAISHDVIGQIHRALDRALEDADAVVIAGRPGRFSAGFDLSVMTAGDQPMQELILAGAEMLLRIYGHPQPTVAACTGHALAGGAILLMACDTRIGASGEFKIGLNEVGIGMALPEFAIELARDRLAVAELTAATAQARIYDPDGAASAGYLDRVAAPDEVLALALDEGRRLGEMRRGAISRTKKRLRSATVQRIRSTLEDDIADLSMG